MTAFHEYVRAIIEQAGLEARADRSATIEAQHVLLAMVARRQSAEARLLGAAGLDSDTLHGALDRERDSSLRAAGLSLAGFEREGASDAVRAPGLGVSVRHAIERGVAGVRRGPRPAHLLLGILRAHVGTVPRALSLAGIDRAALMQRVEQTLVDDI